MKYINIQQVAKNWNVSVRRVQELCKNGTIVGATRFGRAWMVPEATPKPADGRTKQQKEYKKFHASDAKDFLLPVPRQNPFLIHTDLYHTAGSADEVIAEFSKFPETSKMIEAQFDYRRGNIDKTYKNIKYFLEEHKGFYSTISAGILLSFCAIWKGDLNLWRQARSHIYSAPCKTENDRQVVDFWLAIVDSTISDVRSFPDWFRKGIFDCLPADSYCSARVFYVKYLFISAHDLAIGKTKFEDVNGLGLIKTLPYLIEPMISQAKIENTIIPQIYLHLMGATVYHNLGDDKKAILHIDNAIELCLPDKLYGILVEYCAGLDSLLYDRLALVDNDTLTQVKHLFKKREHGWIKLHNLLLERSMSTALTSREKEVAKLAAFGLGNNEIAKRLHIEVSSVKQYIFSAMNKVGANKRNELGLYI